jgi:hypothetical protein
MSRKRDCPADSGVDFQVDDEQGGNMRKVLGADESK